MRRRGFVASAGVVLAALAGCLGDASGDADRADEPSREVDWKPTATGAGGERNEAGNPTATSENDAGDESERSEGDGDADNETGSDESEGSAAAEAFDDGTTWKADEAQVAADAREAGAAVEFELTTAPPEPCGRTCRELRAALTNTGTEDAHGVVVETELASGGTVLRDRRETVGDLSAGETYRATERVELNAIEAVQVQRNGTLTVEHVVTSAERREVFRDRIEP